jgi:ATP-dependent helicase/nuclease subunit A
VRNLRNARFVPARSLERSLNAAYQLDGRAASRAAFYATACDPRRHVAVEACAGAGKTWMLVARIVRALLGGAQPQEVLAITFTRKAAGEMRTRLSSWLREYTTLTQAEATAQLLQFGLDPAEAQQRAADLIGLHERVLASGRSVEVRTMHAWYAQLLAAAPFDLLADLGLSPGMTPVEDTDDLKPALMRRFQFAVQRDAALLDDYRQLAVRHGRYQLGQWLDEALLRRTEVELAAQAGVLDGSVPAAADPRAASRVREPAFVAMVRSLARQLARRDKHKTLAQATADGLIEALSLPDDRKAYERLRAALFTDGGKGTPAKNLGDLPEQAALCAALDRMREQIAQQEAHEDHVAMSRLSRCLFAEYAALKRRLGMVDMNDLERVAVALLSEHTLSGWVQQRLDARVRHLLIDEFQDTSPLQWQALQAWLASYAGAGGGVDAPRVFIVGDPKQSIYRFRRAEPRVFDAAQRFIVDALEGTVAACDHTRRCAPGIVAVLNGVFGTWQGEGGLPQWRDHTTEVAHDNSEGPALTGLPSVERPPKAERQPAPSRVWRPSLTTPRVEAKTVLREAEATQVARAIDHLIRVQGVAAQDILVLARKRSVLQLAADALALHHVPHVAPEDLLLSQLPEVQDLLALLDVLASPTQALSLARALKSPLFGVGDAELLELSLRARAGSGWWAALLASGAEAGPALHRAAQLCKAWARAAPTLPPHDLLDRIVHDGELMPRLAAAVPPERRSRALDAVRALLAAALELDGGRYASPYGFVRALRSRKVEAPASQQEAAVRLLTIHGAKGLEARAVFLMDAQAEPPKVETATLLVDWPVDAAHPVQAAFVASHARCPPSLQALLAAEMAARAREEANALYVALTRAEARLFVSRTPPHNARQGTSSWWARLDRWAVPWSPPAAAAADDDRCAEVVSLPLHQRAAVSAAVPAADDAAAAALGQAVHRTLEWASHDSAHDLPLLAQAAAAAFAVADARAVLAIAERVLASPACRRFFDPRSIAWAGSEVAVASADGQPRRIDRLVLLAEPERCWWVLDYKLAGAPQDDAALLAQLAAYRAAVAALVPGEPVRAAFITARGELIEPAS